MRGGLDDALDKLARRDELRRRAAGEASGQPPAVTELVEAVAAVVARNPELAITMGVEGAGDPVLLHFANEQGVVQVSADNPVVTDSAPAAHRHVDFDLDADVETVETVETVEDHFEAQATQRLQDYLTAPAQRADADRVAEPARHEAGHDTDDRYDAARQYEATGSYEPSRYDRYDDEDTRSNSRRHSPYESVNYDGGSYPDAYAAQPFPEHPYAATPPPPVPPQTPVSRPTLTPLPEPIPLLVEPGSSDVAARRLAALLREDPSLLQQSPPD